jgi:hypothetical protein
MLWGKVPRYKRGRALEKPLMIKFTNSYFYLRGVRHRCPILNENGVMNTYLILAP